jgi:wyosine [tRNA(Phe)-imidazoG37] synthetase (radical SAM superfamily)
MRQAAAANELIDCITVAGHGEPTLHPEFEEIATRLHAVRDRIAPRVRLVILSNSTTADWPDVRRGLLQFDERHMKLDAGDPITYARINGAGLSVRAIIDSLSTLPSIVVQSLFVTDRSHRIDNSTDAAVRDWLAALDHIGPAHVHVYTIDRPPAYSGLRAVSSTRLREIAERARAAGHSAEAIVSSRLKN